MIKMTWAGARSIAIVQVYKKNTDSEVTTRTMGTYNKNLYISDPLPHNYQSKLSVIQGYILIRLCAVSPKKNDKGGLFHE